MGTTHTPKYRRIVAAMLFPLLFVLTACEMSMNITVNEDDTATLEMLMVIPKDGDLPVDDISCDELAEEMAQDTGSDDEFTVEDQSDDESIRCLLKSKPEPLAQMDGQGFKIEHTDGKYLVTTEPDAELQEMGGMLPGFEINVSFTFPGAVEKVETTMAEDNYTIEGNTVKFSGMDFFSSDVSITAAEGNGGGGSTLWVILGIVAVLIIIAVIAVVLAKKKKAGADPNASGPGATQYPAATPQYPQPNTPSNEANPPTGGPAPGAGPTTPPNPQ